MKYFKKLIYFVFIIKSYSNIHVKNDNITKMTNPNLYDVAVIGNGPAGCASSIYVSRGNKKVIMFTGELWGGYLTTTTQVYNYIGYKEIDGLKLMENMVEQAIVCGTIIKEEYVKEVIFSNDKKIPHKLITSHGNTYEAFVIIIATGAKHKHLPELKGPNFDNKGIYYCATCDGTLFKENPHPILVIGGGSTALTEALYLASIVKKVILIHRRNEFRGEHYLVEKVKNTPNIEILWDTELRELKGDNNLQSVIIENNKTKIFTEIQTNGVFIAVGFTPNSQIFQNSILKIHEGGYIVVNPINFRTNIPGVYAVGDVTDSIYRQAITGAGDGAKAAIDSLQYLNFNEN
jgi:thioredoxin reductase (NADPH)